MWLELAIVLLAAATASFGASFLSSGWRKRKRAEPSTLRLEAMLPGYDCGLCGSRECRSYAVAIDTENADPGLCLPGGDRLESLLRAALAEREGDTRGAPLRAVVRCGGRSGLSFAEFHYSGRKDCSSAALLYGGPKLCKSGCLGLGSCVAACPNGAIRVISGLAVVDPATCTGCGECLKKCPVGVISLVPRSQAWYVACSSKTSPSLRSDECSAACTACGECFARSGRSEFGLERGMARENPEAVAGRWQDISEACPTGAIARSGAEKKRRDPLPSRER